MSARRVFARDETGAAAVEFGLVLPALTLGLIGVIQVGAYLHSASTARWALDQAARTLVLRADTPPEALESQVRDRLSAVSSVQAVTVRVEPATISGRPTARVAVTFALDLDVPLAANRRWTYSADTLVPFA